MRKRRQESRPKVAGNRVRTECQTIRFDCKSSHANCFFFPLRDMFRRSSRFFVAKNWPSFVDHYFGHLYPVPGAEVPDLLDVLPGPSDSITDAYKFQSLVLQRLSTKQHGGDHIGYKVSMRMDVNLRNLRASEDVVAPLVSCWRYGNNAHFKKSEKRLQSIEMTLLLELGQDGCRGFEPVLPANPLGLGSFISTVYPAIEITGSRFPFYAPTLQGFIADLASHSGIVVGEPIPAAAVEHIDFAELGGVLLKDDIPVAVGYGKECHGHPLITAAGGLQVARKQCGFDLQQCSGKLIATGSWGRVPASPGRYEANFGPLGKVSMTIQ